MKTEKCSFCVLDMNGALESLYWMLVVLVAVLAPMLVVLVLVVLLRLFCCTRRSQQ